MLLLQNPRLRTKKTYKVLHAEKIICKAKEIIEGGEEDQNYNRIQTDRRGCG